MDEKCWKLAENFIPKSYVRQAEEASRSRQKMIRQLLQHRGIPREGWDDLAIETFLLQLSSMDSNNFPSNCGIGEREGRFAAGLVAKRHYSFSHGIGRSGDLAESQPKAAGSSLIYSLTNALLKDLMRLMGMKCPVECLVVPVATGMGLVLCMLSLKTKRPNAKYVIWSRIDQKSCFKSMLTAGFEPVIIDTIQNGDQLITDVVTIGQKIEELGNESILCIMSTTSCFAPRACDDVESIGKLCKENDIPHLINNAYGLQSEYLMNSILRSKNKGRVDLFIQSTDKNLMVPVGGSVICSFDKNLVNEVAKKYPGRASASPIIDVLITLLSLGQSGYSELVNKRVEVFDYLCKRLCEVADLFNEHILENSENPISIAISLQNIPEDKLTQLGSMLFWRNVSGSRVITRLENKTIEKFDFKGWGSHTSHFSTPYLTAAASLGAQKNDVDLFIKRLTNVLKEILVQQNPEPSS